MRFQLQNRLVLIAILAAMYQAACSQIYPARFYSTLDGLPTNSVFDITQDHEGVMWFVTARGVVSYDGQKWSQPPDSLRLPNSPYSYIKSTKDNSIWVAGQNNTSFQISRLNNGAWQAIDVTEEIENIAFGFPFEVNVNGEEFSIWLANNNQVFEYESINNEWKAYPFPNQIHTLVYLEENLYICSDNGLFQIKDESVSPVILDENFPNNNILNIVIKEKKKYVLGYDWLAILDGENIQYWESLGMKNHSRFNKHPLVVDDRDRIFYNNFSPVQIFDPMKGVSETIEIKDKIQNAKSIAIYKDLENNIWVGDHRGLFRFNLLRFLNFDSSVGLLEDEVSSIIQLKNGEIILANPTSINFLKNNRVTRQTKLPIRENQIGRVLDLFEDQSGRLIMALGPAGLYVYDNKNFERIIYPSKPDLDFTSIIQWKGRLLVSSRKGGLFEFHENGLRKISDLRGVRKLDLLNENEITANTQRGFYKISQTDTIQISSGLRDVDNVFSVIEWNQEVFVATDAGLYTLIDEKISNVPFLDIRLPVYALMKDLNNNLWIGTGDGVLKWDGNDLKKYNRSHGLIGSETNRRALIQDRQGKVWIGTELGASVYEEKEDLTLNFSPIVSITSIVNGAGDVLDPNKTNQISFGQNTVEIFFRGVSFINEKRIEYRYKLEGLDTKWLQLDNKSTTSARYTNLKSGKYTFVVQSKIDQGYWSPPARAVFSIDVPFYLEWWFLSSIFLIGIAILYIIYRLRFLYLLRRQQELKDLIAARTREITQLNESLEAIVNERTKELEEKNQRLSDYAYINAHLLRGPLTRIQSLTLLLDFDKNEKMSQEYLQILKEATDELDEVIFSINTTLREKKEEFNSVN